MDEDSITMSSATNERLTGRMQMEYIENQLAKVKWDPSDYELLQGIESRREKK